MIKQIERQVRELQRELMEAQKQWDLVRLQSCWGDAEIRQKDESLDGLEKRMDALHEKIRELERKRREMMSEGIKKADYESPFT
jgi:chromosome segregation ATPase